jgi:outer membrane protein assembly factor BamB
MNWFAHATLPRRFAFSLLGVLALANPVGADDWPQWLGPQRDGVWRETGIVEEFPSDGAPVRWRTEIGGGYAGPAVAAGRVYVTDRIIARGERDPNSPFQRGAARSTERVLCLNEADGKLLWKHEYDCTYTISYPAGPRTTPTVDGDRVYTLGAEGHLLCLESKTGKVVWSRELKKDYAIRQSPVWGFSSHPLVDGGKLICLVGGDGTAAVAFDKQTGKELWRALSATDAHGPGYCPPMIFEAGGLRQLIAWLPDALNSLDPETGKPYWSQPFQVNSGLTIPTPRKFGDLLFVTCFYNGPMMLRLDPAKPAASLLWRGTSSSEKNTDKLHAIICTPWLEDGYVYGVCSYGQLRCLKVDTGERVWEDLRATGSTGNIRKQTDRWRNAFIVKHGDRFFLPNEEGDLIIAKLSPKGYEEISRTHLLAPTNSMPGREVVWSHPAFANRCVYARNDKEIVCVSLAATGTAE